MLTADDECSEGALLPYAWRHEGAGGDVDGERQEEGYRSRRDGGTGGEGQLGRDKDAETEEGR